MRITRKQLRKLIMESFHTDPRSEHYQSMREFKSNVRRFFTHSIRPVDGKYEFTHPPDPTEHVVPVKPMTFEFNNGYMAVDYGDELAFYYMSDMYDGVNPSNYGFRQRYDVPLGHASTRGRARGSYSS